MAPRARPAEDLFARSLLPEEEPTYSISDINEMVQAALHGSFPKSVWVRGEIQGYDLRKHRDTVSFTLAEKAQDSDDVTASVTAIMFRPDRTAIESTLRRAENAFELRDGIEVRFKVDVDLWVKAGRYQLRVRSIDPTYTLGRLAQTRKRILDSLAQRGLIHKNKQLAVPLVPLRVGLIAAEGSAGLNDFLTHLRQSGYAFVVQFINAAMQGSQVEADVMKALAHFNRAAAVDVIVITRGGGAATDLSWFDRLKLAEAVATSKLPVLTGLGHTHDTSVVDLVAHTDLKTPTDAAQFLVNRVAEFLEALSDIARQLNQRAVELLETHRAHFEDGARTISQGAQALVQSLTVWLADRQRHLAGQSASFVSMQWQFLRGCLQRATPERVQQLLGREQHRTREVQDRVLSSTRRLLLRTREELLAHQRACAYPRLNRAALRESQWLSHMASTVARLDPAKTLKRGFSIVRSAEGRIISKVGHVAIDELLMTQVSDGYIRSRVHSTEPFNDEDPDG